MSQDSLFPGADLGPTQPLPPEPGAPRFQVPVRNQVEWIPAELDRLLDPDHRARLVWRFVTSLDLQPFYGRIRAVSGRAGRPPIDPRILMGLWLLATLEGVGSARGLARLCEEHLAYRWMCGGVSVNHHTLSDFRVDHGDRLDELLSQSVASLMAEGLVTLDRVSQDGVRVRAGAGTGSFRSKDALDECLREAREQVQALKREVAEDPSAASARQASARARAAREREERIQRALEQREEVAKRKSSEEERREARASTTDPEARVMKMGDGGFRPAVNGQFAVDTGSQIVVGVDATQAGGDCGQLGPMLKQLRCRYRRGPREILVDGGFFHRVDFEEAAKDGTEVYAPTRSHKRARHAENAARPDDLPGVARWRERMGTAQAKEIYKERAATVECVNALARNRGLQRLLVRGLAKARTVLLWFALAHNLMREASLRRGLAAAA